MEEIGINLLKTGWGLGKLQLPYGKTQQPEEAVIHLILETRGTLGKLGHRLAWRQKLKRKAS